MTTTSEEKIRFPYPDEVPTPEGAEGWEEMYPSHYRFSPPEARDEAAIEERKRFWFWDSLHTPVPMLDLDNLTSTVMAFPS